MTPEQKAAEETKQDLIDVIQSRISYFQKKYHWYEADQLKSALTSVRDLIPPENFNQSPTPEAVAVDWNSVIHDVLSDGTFHNEGLAEKLSEKYKIVNVEAVAVAFGEWLRKRRLRTDGKHWQKYHAGGEKTWHTTAELFTLFTQSPEYKALK